MEDPLPRKHSSFYARSFSFLTCTMLVAVALLLQSCKKETTELQNEYKFSERSKLELTDFRGYPNIWSEFDAATHSGYRLDYEEKIENGKLVLVFTCYSFFDATESWFRKDSKTEALLQHEQLHFHISEICCRLFKQKLSQYTFTKNYEQEISDLYSFSYSDLFGWQHKYDKESEHSTNEAGQKYWEDYVTKTLQELEAYAPETMVNKTNVPITEGELKLNKIGLQTPDS